MNMYDLEKILLLGVDEKTVGMKYAQGFGRCLGIMWGMVERMSPKERDEFIAMLGRRAEWWSEGAKKVEESTT